MKPKAANKPWVEKYRPTSMSEIQHQDEVLTVLKKSFVNQDFPNLLFYGPPGTGKTSTILAMARDLFGDMYRERLLELNASDERGINVVRNKVKDFSHTSVHSITNSKGQHCPALKLVILDEADCMTHAAQAALRRIMEKESRTTRFCLVCNYVSRIIEPIASRCAKFRFKSLPCDVMQARLKFICEKEEVKIGEECLSTLMEVAEGDLRRAITTLQTCARVVVGGNVGEQDVLDVSGLIEDSMLLGVLEACRSGSYQEVIRVSKNFLLEGYPVSQLLHQLLPKLLSDRQLNDSAKSSISFKIAEVDKALLDGADEGLQLLSLCATILQAYQTS